LRRASPAAAPMRSTTSGSTEPKRGFSWVFIFVSSL
jgi:hypothetical protein